MYPVQYFSAARTLEASRIYTRIIVMTKLSVPYLNLEHDKLGRCNNASHAKYIGSRRSVNGCVIAPCQERPASFD